MAERPVPPAIPSDVVAIVLAAGRGSRFHGPTAKLLAPFRGERVIDRALGAPHAAGFSRIVLVSGAIDLSPVPLPGLTVATNPDPDRGQASSLQVGLATASDLGAVAVVIGLGDAPLVEPACWRRVALADSPLAAAEHDGVRGPPVKVALELWRDLPTVGDHGAKDLLRVRAGLVTAVPCGGVSVDIDTVEDLARWS